MWSIDIALQIQTTRHDFRNQCGVRLGLKFITALGNKITSLDRSCQVWWLLCYIATRYTSRSPQLGDWRDRLSSL